ncbi:MAG: hypothetical protein U5L09_15065 [Bacteroidales bacterium]|nr:hypothetical protein [Bacteroidales bacterium]
MESLFMKQAYRPTISMKIWARPIEIHSSLSQSAGLQWRGYDSTINKHLTKGDKLYLIESDNESNYKKAWVLKNNISQSVLVDTEGNLISDNKYNITVIRSGYNNKSNTPVAKITSLNNPISGSRLNLNQNLQVLSATAKEYKEDWQTYAGFSVAHIQGDCNCDKQFQTNYNSTHLATAYNPVVRSNTYLTLSSTARMTMLLKIRGLLRRLKRSPVRKVQM